MTHMRRDYFDQEAKALDALHEVEEGLLARWRAILGPLVRLPGGEWGEWYGLDHPLLRLETAPWRPR